MTLTTLLRDSHDARIAMIDTHAHRPAASDVAVNAYYFETDTNHTFQSTGAAWTDLGTGVLTAADVSGAEQTANRGAANGYAPLDGSSKVPAANLPTPAANVSSLKASGQAAITGDAVLAAGTNVTLSESGQTITIAASSGATPPMTTLYDSTLGSDAASIDTGAGGVAAGYTELEVSLLLRGTTVAQNCQPLLRLNNDSGTDYKWFVRYSGSDATTGTINSASDTKWRVGLCPAASANANAWARIVVRFFLYDDATTWKSAYFGGNGPDASSGIDYSFEGGGTWRIAPVAISRIAALPDANNWKAGSRMLIRGTL